MGRLCSSVPAFSTALLASLQPTLSANERPPLAFMVC